MKSSQLVLNRATLLVLFLVNVLNFYDRQAFGAVLEPLRREFHLSDAQLGGLTTAFTLLYAVAGVPLGRLADTWSRRKLLAAGVAVWACLTGLGGLARNYASLAVTRLGVGVGEAVCAPAATSWLADLVPAARRTHAMAWFMMAVPVGGFLSFSVGGPVAQAFGWRVALAVAALPGLVLAPALLLLREPGAGTASEISAAKSTASPWQFATDSGFRLDCRFRRRRQLRPLQLFHISAGHAGALSRVDDCASRRVDRGRLGYLRCFGRAGGWGTGRSWGRSRRQPSGGPPLASGRDDGAGGRAGSLCRDARAGRRRGCSVVLLMLAYGLLQTYYGLVYAAIQDIVPAHLRGTAMAAYYMAMYLCGASFGPLATGKLSDWLAARAAAAGSALEAARAAGLHQAMYSLPVLALALALVLWRAARAVREET